MKRIKSACIMQTLHFFQKEDQASVKGRIDVQEEIRRYKAGLDRSCTKYKILSETVQSDGSVILEIIKQYNASPVGKYLD